MRLPAALLAVCALAACEADFSGSACTTCTPDAAAPGRPDAARPDVDLCAGVVCSDPPADGCDGEMVAVYPAEGECDPTSGECVYTPTTTACDQPPSDECSDDTLIEYPAAGSCVPGGGEPRCQYTPAETDCTASDRRCQGGACVDPCQPNPCTSPPPPRCTGPNLHTFASPGDCTSPAGAVECAYTETVTNCAIEGQVCDPEQGRCVDGPQGPAAPGTPR